MQLQFCEDVNSPPGQGGTCGNESFLDEGDKCVGNFLNIHRPYFPECFHALSVDEAELGSHPGPNELNALMSDNESDNIPVPACFAPTMYEGDEVESQSLPVVQSTRIRKINMKNWPAAAIHEDCDCNYIKARLYVTNEANPRAEVCSFIAGKKTHLHFVQEDTWKQFQQACWRHDAVHKRQAFNPCICQAIEELMVGRYIDMSGLHLVCTAGGLAMPLQCMWLTMQFLAVSC